VWAECRAFSLFLYFEKIKWGLRDHLAVCPSVYPPYNFCQKTHENTCCLCAPPPIFFFFAVRWSVKLPLFLAYNLFMSPVKLGTKNHCAVEDQQLAVSRVNLCFGSHDNTFVLSKTFACFEMRPSVQWEEGCCKGLNISVDKCWTAVSNTDVLFLFNEWQFERACELLSTNQFPITSQRRGWSHSHRKGVSDSNGNKPHHGSAPQCAQPGYRVCRSKW
jgi:hypothetical protein